MKKIIKTLVLFFSIFATSSYACLEKAPTVKATLHEKTNYTMCSVNEIPGAWQKLSVRVENYEYIYSFFLDENESLKLHFVNMMGTIHHFYEASKLNPLWSEEKKKAFSSLSFFLSKAPKALLNAEYLKEDQRQALKSFAKQSDVQAQSYSTTMFTGN